MEILFSPLFAFPIYVLLVGILVVLGYRLTDSPTEQVTDTSLYASGEAPPDDDDRVVPGYRPFFLIALFFAVLHLGVVVLSTSTMSPIAILYLSGLMLALFALILG